MCIRDSSPSLPHTHSISLNPTFAADNPEEGQMNTKADFGCDSLTKPRNELQIKLHKKKLFVSSVTKGGVTTQSQQKFISFQAVTKGGVTTQQPHPAKLWKIPVSNVTRRAITPLEVVLGGLSKLCEIEGNWKISYSVTGIASQRVTGCSVTARDKGSVTVRDEREVSLHVTREVSLTVGRRRGLEWRISKRWDL
eukprot:1378018-Amorphochlora_amoeboformis.AAC.1